jgi:hypothetical protein
MQPTPYPDVNAALKTMRDSVRDVLGNKFVGFYVYGSLANGDFDLDKSDIDAVVVTTDPLDEAAFEKLKSMHAGLFESGAKWIRETELFYMPRADMKKYDRAHKPRMRLHEGRFTADFWQGDDWVLHRHVLREQGIIVAGPHPNTMIDPVSPQAIHDAVAVGILQNWWENKVLQKPERLRDDMYQAHAIMTMCRALFTLETGKISSKTASAAWAQEKLGEPFKSLIGRAGSWKPDMAMNDYRGTLNFIRYTVNKAKLAKSSQ